MTETTSNASWPQDRLSRNWTIIGGILLAAPVAQPIVARYLSTISPANLLAPMTTMTGGEPLPQEVEALFAGVFANIRFSLAFAAVELMAGGLILAADLWLSAAADWRRAVLIGASNVGIAAFVGIGLYFAYSSVVIGSATNTPLTLSLIMAMFGCVVAFFPARWLWRNSRILRQV
ncbi:hypothetical protein [Actibacterium sp. 188UL27-1]|uniref:hypothetical protein n=1 Tax=Actibacterium sp. 188UL27-1 TaxID=2786961 RepID=UPI00195CFEEB|nr:hypothetical protein [Actibacterium sp. 188UL27-1]MBM7068925.1 hypothetical protein [Actibacterium sp. 188UL27-1]